jgi:hypothetical protein
MRADLQELMAGAVLVKGEDERLGKWACHARLSRERPLNGSISVLSLPTNHFHLMHDVAKKSIIENYVALRESGQLENFKYGLHSGLTEGANVILIQVRLL